MKVIIYGSNGWIASYLKNHLLNQSIEFYCSEHRVDDEKLIEEELLRENPTHMLCMIGKTHGTYEGNYIPTIDYLEKPGKLQENIRDNLYCPLILAFLAQKHSKHLTYFGTGCIFNYDDTHPFADQSNGFNEEDKPNFFGSSYSIVKGFTDRLMHQFDSSVLNIRIRMPITADYNKRNFITKIISYDKICSIPNSMSVLPDILPIIVQMMLNKETGTYNMVNPGLISHNEILELYREIVNPNFTWKNFTIDEQDQILASKRSNNYLSTDKLSNKYSIPDIKDSIRLIMHELKNYS
jgi:3,5-epimerase/4-reductase